MAMYVECLWVKLGPNHFQCTIMSRIGHGMSLSQNLNFIKIAIIAIQGPGAYN